MKSREFWDLGDVTDAEIHAHLSQLLVVGYRTEARIVAHLAEVEERRLHLRGGSSSMFDYCVQRLGLSNGEAFQRLTVARLARRFPLIFELLERREVHLTGLCLLRDYLTLGNHRELLAEASRKTKWQIQELLARRFPRADVAATIRTLPAARSTSAGDRAPVGQASATPATTLPPATTVSPVPPVSLAATVSPMPPSLLAATVAPMLSATIAPRAPEATPALPTGDAAAVAAASEKLCWTGLGGVAAPQAPQPRRLRSTEATARARLEPTSPNRYRLQVVCFVLRTIACSQSETLVRAQLQRDLANGSPRERKRVTRSRIVATLLRSAIPTSCKWARRRDAATLRVGATLRVRPRECDPANGRDADDPAMGATLRVGATSECDAASGRDAATLRVGATLWAGDFARRTLDAEDSGEPTSARPGAAGRPRRERARA